MAGPQHTFQGNFANVQQQNAMRSQFVGGPQMGGMMGAVQQGMVSPQPYGMGGGMAGSMQQNQQMAVQMQQQQQMQQQVKANQNVPPQVQQQAQMAVSQPGGPPSGGGGQTPGTIAGPSPSPGVGQGGGGGGQVVQGQTGGPVQNQAGGTTGQPQTQSKEINTAALCRYGQEQVQDILLRITEVFGLLKSLHPPNGTPQAGSSCNEKKAKIQELLSNIRILFKRLSMIYQRCNDTCQLPGMEYMHIESLIPLKEDWDQKADEKKMSESYRLACEERREIMEQVILKNKHLKEVIDSMRRIVWEINSMLCMRRS